jgi:hypothetical protein
VAVTTAGRVTYRTAHANQRAAAVPVLLALVGTMFPLLGLWLLALVGLEGQLAFLPSLVVGVAFFVAAGQIAGSHAGRFMALGIGVYLAAAALSVGEVFVVFWLSTILPFAVLMVVWVGLAVGSAVVVFAVTVARGAEPLPGHWPSSPPPGGDAGPPARWGQFGGTPPDHGREPLDGSP